MIEELKFDKKLAKTHSKQRCFGFFFKKKKIKLTQNDVILIIFLPFVRLEFIAAL